MKHLLLFSLISLTGCSSFRERALVSMAGGFAGGYLAGHQMAPKDDNQNLHGILMGGMVSSIIGAGMIYFLNEDDMIREKNKKIESLYKKLNNKKYKNIKPLQGRLGVFGGKKTCQVK